MKPIPSTSLLAFCLMGISIGSAPAFSNQAEDQGTITEGSKVTIAFTLMIPEEQEVIPNNVSEYVHGKDQVLPKLKAALTGMKTGERKRIDLQPDEAFGPYDEQKMMRVRRDESPPTARTGSVYQTPHGEPFTVVALSESTAVIDFNHPLAGKHLVLDVEVLRVEHPS
ncbi:MAG: hypothetical protein C4293_18160 [Nitrospiraceae bacterium]